MMCVAKGRRRKPQVRCQSEPKGYGQRHHVRFDSSPHQVAGSLPAMQELSVVPAEIIKMLALVGLQKASKRCNDVP